MKDKKVLWKCTTNLNRWTDMPPLIPVHPDNDNPLSEVIIIDQNTVYQEIKGWGGCFNERGWDAVSILSQDTCDSVISAFFDPIDGCKFNICRMPIGASDFAMDMYTLNDTQGDYAMEHFSIERDKQKLIPFIKAAMVYKPDLKMWGIPWTPPKWLKTSNMFTGGYLKQDEQSLNAYALYFEKYVQAYRNEGIDIFAIMPQNEPCWDMSDYTACGYTDDENYNFMKNYLIPRFKNNLNCEIWIGSLVNTESGIHIKFDFVSKLLSDSAISSDISGVGCQYGDQIMTQVHNAYPDIELMQTETYCGDHENNWTYAEDQFREVKKYLDAGANSYMLWNMILDETGRSFANWAQCSPVTIDRKTKTVVYNPQFYMFKHFSHYVVPGAKKIETSGNWDDKIAFENPDGNIVLVLQNAKDSDNTIVISFNGKMVIPTLPARSWNTFII
jgi:glucosylceramidase